MTRSAKHYCFTVNNYTEQDESALSTLAETVSYLVYGRECGANGTPHLQGFVSFKTRKTFNQAKTSINARAHLEVARGSPQENRNYCKKDGDYEEFGECPVGQGKRSDLEVIAERLREGEQLRKIAHEHPGSFIRYSTGLRRFAEMYTPQRSWVCTVIVYYGATGTGKTRRVHQAEDDLWSYPGGGWFDGYEGQEAALFDDFGGHEFKLTYLLKLLDQYPMRVPIKGSFMNWLPKRIYLTSNVAPNMWYANALDMHKRALLRRLHIIVQFLDNNNTVRIKP
jgi:hypothetical protein